MAYSKEVFAGNLRAQRARLRMSQQDLADASGVNVQSIQTYECEQAVPSVEKACMLADALGIGLNDLAGYEPPTMAGREEGRWRDG